MTMQHQPAYPKATYSRAEFCHAHGISLTHFHAMVNAGIGPRLMKAGRRLLISVEAAADWRREMEERTAQTQVAA
ncbi:hypothetical protein OVY01_18450 [Robbsia sp. Bb-Pol-6]|uniref:Helix-turn-helix domain-containing protein n=1 Tax=Robbsia betulipollinis TaxID=2981849 RepID=A0ABT3ZSD8_9BURK|nr:hypothetical protein [Robbsia betulipollinis]MCY0389130.1 hypothetical protein [Robbsia betulipollinis]